MKPQTPLENVLQKDVSRQEFIVLLGSGVASVLGISSIIHFLTGKKIGKSSWRSSYGYGNGNYGQ